MIVNRLTRTWTLWMLGALIVAGLAFALTPGTPAQTKKTDPKTKEKESSGDKEKGKETPKKEAKAKPLPATFPARKDFIDPAHGGSEYVALIDQSIRKGWKDNKVHPSERCSDHEFIRRASLDIIGRIPTVEEITAYMKQPESKRRSWLINAMLDGKEYGYGTEYAQNSANLWTIMLITRSGSNQHHKDQLNSWLYDQFKGEATASSSSSSPEESTQPKDKDKGKKPKTTESTGGTKPASKSKDADWAEIARALIAGDGPTNKNAAVNYLLHNLGDEIKQDNNKNGRWDMVPATSRTTRIFLGIRTQCVQCHDHPFNGEWGQHHFWGVNAFLRQVDSISSITNQSGRPNPDATKKKKKGMTGQVEFTLKDRKEYNSNGLIGFERRNTLYLFTDPSFLDGKKIPKDFKGTRREALGGFITGSPWFAKAYVNRTWAHFFGKSFTKDNADDFGEHNPVSHPELLEKLAEDWATKYKHNPKALIRWICNSEAYGLSSRANEWNDKVDDETLFARMLLKPLSPEVMYASVIVASHPDWHTMSSEKKNDLLGGGEKWYEQLVRNFGNDEGEEGVYTGTVVQALLLMNGQETNKALTDKAGTVQKVIDRRGASMKSLPFAIDDMFLHALSRYPSPKEKQDLMSPNMYNFRKGSSAGGNQQQFWTNYYQDVFWALLNSNEFILNH